MMTFVSGLQRLISAPLDPILRSGTALADMVLGVVSAGPGRTSTVPKNAHHPLMLWRERRQHKDFAADYRVASFRRRFDSASQQ